ncbi:MAG: iron-containing redox enzyme family protein [Bdellovibrionaceae bacterium]|nr:iron-containing redox enzyme family protein [Pseudobdellovibrionaceae bacterium]
MSYKWDVKSLANKILEAPWENREFYEEYLSQVYHYVSFSTRMLAAAAAVTESRGFYKRLVAHIREEEGHERLALNDLKKMEPAGEVRPELGITRALWEPQFYKVQRRPEALLGYVLALEMLAIEVFPPLLPRLQAAHGDACVSFVRVHAEEDPHHVTEALEQIEALGEIEKQQVWKNFEQTCVIMQHFVDDINAAAAARSAPRRVVNLHKKRAA